MTDVAIVGAGPVGLDLANRLVQSGVSVTVLEARERRGRHSRSIGIHAPSLALLAETGVRDALLERGLRIPRGRLFTPRGDAGTLDLAGAEPLAVPQYVTEEVLEAALPEGVVRRGVRVAGLSEEPSEAVLATGTGPLPARFVVAADGQDSTLRQALGIAFPGGPYSDTYAMGDFEDNTGLGHDAAICLTSEGLVESFPLPGGIRRWVVRTRAHAPDPDPEWVCAAVADRSGFRPDAATCSMVSGFRVHRHLAATMARGRVLLAGDAAHVVSPIGGQGMNVGWLDSRDAAGVLLEALGGADHEPLFEAYSRRRRRTARQAARRAAFNMAFGRPGMLAPLKRAAAGAMLRPPLAAWFVRQFTMGGLT